LKPSGRSIQLANYLRQDELSRPGYVSSMMSRLCQHAYVCTPKKESLIYVNY